MTSPYIEYHANKLGIGSKADYRETDFKFRRQMSPATRGAEWEDRLPPLQSKVDLAWSGFFLGCIVGVLTLMFWLGN